MRQVLVKKTKHTKELAFNEVTLLSTTKNSFQPGEITAVNLDLDLETVDVLQKSTLSFIWVLNPKLSRLGGMLLGVDTTEKGVVAYISTVKAFNSKEEFPILTGKAVETVALRQIEMSSEVISLDRSGVEL